MQNPRITGRHDARVLAGRLPSNGHGRRTLRPREYLCHEGDDGVNGFRELGHVKRKAMRRARQAEKGTGASACLRCPQGAVSLPGHPRVSHPPGKCASGLASGPDGHRSRIEPGQDRNRLGPKRNHREKGAAPLTRWPSSRIQRVP